MFYSNMSKLREQKINYQNLCHTKSKILYKKVGAKPSYMWTSLVQGLELLAEGLRWQVGDGQHVLIFFPISDR